MAECAGLSGDEDVGVEQVARINPGEPPARAVCPRGLRDRCRVLPRRGGTGLPPCAGHRAPLARSLGHDG